MGAVVRRSSRTARTLVPPDARYFKGRSMRLQPGAEVAWHTTGRREEVLVIVKGTPLLRYHTPAGQLRQLRLKAGDCVFLARGIHHAVHNPFRSTARYLYFTAGPQ